MMTEQSVQFQPLLSFGWTAVFIDAENFPARCYGALHSLLRLLPPICQVVVVADFSSKSVSPWLVTLPRYKDIRKVDVQRPIPGKNACDIALAVEAIALVQKYHNSGQGNVVVVGSDSDYLYLAEYLRNQGHRVIGVGRHNSNALYVNRFDEFFFYAATAECVSFTPASATQFDSSQSHERGDVADSGNQASVTDQPRYVDESDLNGFLSLVKNECAVIPDPTQILRNIVGKSVDWVPLARVGGELRQAIPGFSVRSLGFRLLSEWIEAQSANFEIRRVGQVSPVAYVRTRIASGP